MRLEIKKTQKTKTNLGINTLFTQKKTMLEIYTVHPRRKKRK